MSDKIIVDELLEDELNDFSTIMTNTIKEICIFADKHNFDRDNMLQYLANSLTIMSEISTVENYNVSPKTNADRIRNMTDLELAEFLNKVFCREVDITGECKDSKCIKKYCTECTREWLQKEVE